MDDGITGEIAKLALHPNPEKQPLYVCNPEIKEALKNYVVYTVAGNLTKGKKIIRRFSDFYSLRKKLCERFPGVYIPNIPPKKAVGNLVNDVIESRMRLLNLFCNQIANTKYLLESEECQIFLSNTNDASKAIDKLPSLKYEAILNNYRKAFTDYYEAYDLIIGKGKLKEFLHFFKVLNSSLKSTREIINQAALKRKDEIEGYANLMKSVNDYEKLALRGMSGNEMSKMVFSNQNNPQISQMVDDLKNRLNNPYIILQKWLEEQDLEIEALIEGLNSFFSLCDSFDKLDQRSDFLKDEIKHTQYSQENPLKKMFGLSSNKDDTITKLEESKQKTENEITKLHNIIKLASFNMECFLEYFKEDKIKEYYRVLKIFAILQKGNNQTLSELWRIIGAEQNMQLNKAE